MVLIDALIFLVLAVALGSSFIFFFSARDYVMALLSIIAAARLFYLALQALKGMPL